MTSADTGKEGRIAARSALDARVLFISFVSLRLKTVSDRACGLFAFAKSTKTTTKEMINHYVNE